MKVYVVPRLWRCLMLALLAAFAAPQIAAAQPGFDSSYDECVYDITRMERQVDPMGQFGVKPSDHKSIYYGYIAGTELSQSNAVLPFPDNNGDGVSDKPDPGFWVNNGYQIFYPSTTCRGGYNWPNDWSPLAFVNGVKAPNVADPGLRTVKNARLIVQYRAPSDKLSLPRPYGEAEKVGNAHAESWAEQDVLHVRWACGVTPNLPTTERPQACPGGHVTVVFYFPDCWDRASGWTRPSSPGAEWYAAALISTAPAGWDAGTPQPVKYDSKVGINASHFAYSTFAGCPPSHPHRIAQAVFWRQLSTPSGAPLTDPAGLSFSGCGGPWCAHFHYMVNYGKSYLVPRVLKCLNNRPVFPTLVCNQAGIAT